MICSYGEVTPIPVSVCAAPRANWHTSVREDADLRLQTDVILSHSHDLRFQVRSYKHFAIHAFRNWVLYLETAW